MAKNRPEPANERTRGLIEGMAMVGASIEEIASALDIPRTTIMRDYRDAMAGGRDRGIVRLRKHLYDIATHGASAQTVQAAIFLHKTRLGAHERVEVTGAGGGAIQHEHGRADDARTRIMARIERLAQGLPLLPAQIEADVAETVAAERAEDGPEPQP